MVSFFTLAFALSWIAWTPYCVGMNGLGLDRDIRIPAVLGSTQFIGVLPGAYLGPIFSAFLVTAICDGRAGLRRWAGRLFRFKVKWFWYALTILGVPLVLTVVTLPFSAGRIIAPSAMVLVAMGVGLIVQMVTTGVAEEPGWRDFALPRLQPRYGALRANLILGPLWGAWHLPLFCSEWGGYPNVQWYAPIEFVATAILFSFVMTWVFNRTGQSLPLAMLLHVSVNNTFSTSWALMFPGLGRDVGSHVFFIASAIFAVIVLVGTRGRLGWDPDSAEPGQTGPRPVREAA